MNVLESLRVLKGDMENNGWVIDAFPFTFKEIDYIVLVKLYDADDVNRPKYALLELEFLKKNNISDNLVAPANTTQLLITPKELRTYFGIEWSENLRDILSQFYEFFSRFIPLSAGLHRTPEIDIAMVRSLSMSDSQDPRRVYCFSAKRNPNEGHRTQYNDNKTRILRPVLYSKLSNDPKVSFNYSLEKSKEKSDSEIISNFSSNR
ncbi:DUF6037 family protein [Aeromonas hydrophila]|uniref:DUF6037 family protein n=1 Tax=Aeromonas hydrophila TaxID=644 RepID=UPI0009B7EC45|nr:DUF6037 family protein [Aeromonas hydrophila]EJN6953657.1 hypothetical protein [Aeromonas hydrophila]MCX4039174.1 DUF6037 family protein [Aeromonas hydrophila]TNI68263.1 hypothetical protein CF124_02845 [Aeromonas hydrophila]CAD7548860.1 hypothetical protein KBAH04_30890 [Aeromonas hydrophila]HAU4873544.1 hypothetical protein [Aeromonas hydrophila]